MTAILAAYLQAKQEELALKGQICLTIRVKTGMPVTVWLGLLGENGPLRLGVKALPLRGRANQEVAAFVADYFGVGKQQVVIKQGLTLPNKLLLIRR